jgi:hypothetical protein
MGPYVNAYKPGEQPKDFYLRALYPGGDSSELIYRIVQSTTNNPYVVSLVGGATKEMFAARELFGHKSLQRGSGSEFTENTFAPVRSDFRVIPIRQALNMRHVVEQVTQRLAPREVDSPSVADYVGLSM